MTFWQFLHAHYYDLGWTVFAFGMLGYYMWDRYMDYKEKKVASSQRSRD